MGLSEESFNFIQSSSPHQILIERSGDVNAEVKVHWSFTDIENGADYAELAGTVSFAPGVCEMPVLFASPLMTKTVGEAKLNLQLTTDTKPIITRIMEAPVVVVNDIEPAKIGFKLQSATEIKQSDKQISLLLTRTGFAFRRCRRHMVNQHQTE